MGFFDLNDPDILGQLQGATWRGISVPMLMLDTEGGHGVVSHGRMDTDGVRVENTGRKGYVFHFAIPFINTIVPSTNELWTAGALYPAVYQRVITALEDRSDGELVHPVYGKRNCKVGPYKDTLNADYRGGAIVTVTLLESTADGDAASLVQDSAVSIAQTAARSLDATLSTFFPVPDTGTPGGIGLLDFVKSLGAIADQIDLVKMQVAGQINRVTSTMTNLADKFAGVAGFADNSHRLISSLHATQATLLQKDKRIATYQTLAATTVGALATRLKSTVKDLFTLNPDFAAGPVVPGLVTVLYYAS